MKTLGYSAVVALRLILNGETIEVGKTGPDRITLVEPRELAAGPADLMITIDGESTIYPVILQAPPGALADCIVLVIRGFRRPCFYGLSPPK